MLLNSNRTFYSEICWDNPSALSANSELSRFDTPNQQKSAQNIKEGFSGNQDALRLPSKKKPAQSQVK
jgi:hypothetical protein